MSSINDLERFRVAWKQRSAIPEIDVNEVKKEANVAIFKALGMITIEIAIVVSALILLILTTKDTSTYILLLLYILLSAVTVYQVTLSRIKEIRILSYPTKKYNLMNKRVLIQKLKRAIIGVYLSISFLVLAFLFLVYDLFFLISDFWYYVFSIIWSSAFLGYYLKEVSSIKKELNL